MIATTAVGAGLAGNAGPPAQSSASASSLDPNQFLKLLVAELQYQDPTKPMDTTQLVQQLSSLSQVQQSAQSNTMLSSILEQLSIGQATALVGRSVSSADGTTSGLIEAVQLTADGPLATLSGGQTLLVSHGVTIRK